MKQRLFIYMFLVLSIFFCSRICLASSDIDEKERNDINKLLYEGATSYSHKEYNAAIQAYKKVIVIDPMDSRAYLGLSQTYNAQRRYKSATLNALNALKINPGDKYARSFLCTISSEQQRYEVFNYASEKGAV